MPYVGDTGLPKGGDQAVGGCGPADHCPAQPFRRVRGDRHLAPVPQHQSLVVTVGGVPQPGRQVGEETPDDLPRGGPGDGPGLVHALGELVRGELGTAPVEQPGEVDARRTGDHPGDGHLAEGVVGHAGDRDVGHALGHTQCGLDLVGVDVLTAADDDVLEAAADGEVAGFVAPGQVAGAEPAVL
ncbi:hypothetical protein Saso_51390 [Streptomyces asoensis]|uniref:Uncharacterized protein n=1 Tax=Streptomyces asoensis TaxID=249586 RepID=A0ABQ3S5U2_9ACTN|nr:hypothetical protein Saso_51390 [Streptomyces asoensis]